MFKRTVAVVTILAAIFCLAFRVDAAARHKADDTWLVYWYNCGSDNLEGGAHFSTRDVAEMQRVKLPPNVNVLIYAGGTEIWHHPTITAEGDGLYLYNQDGLQKLDASSAADMGDPNTLLTFLQYGEENFAADHRIIIFQNHGGLSGICYDDKFAQEVQGDDGQTYKTQNYLTYDALKAVFAEVYGDAPEEFPFELVAFNACMTGSYELANSISGYTRYMMGSEPSSNPVGWDFQALFGALAKNSATDGAQIGKVICDSAMKHYDDPDIKNFNLKTTNAFSVIDLSKMPELREAYEAYFDEATRRADRKGFIGAFARAADAKNVDKYSYLYTDLGLLAENTKAIMPAASAKLLKAIENAVVYNKHGADLRAKGISTYYPYISQEVSFGMSAADSTKLDFEGNILNQASTYQGQKDFYAKLLNVDLSGVSVEVPLERNSKGHLFAKLEPEQLGKISSVECILLPLKDGDGDSGLGPLDIGGAILMPTDDLQIDWNKGIVTENFRAVEPVFDGHNIAMRRVHSGRGHTFYSVPIYYNAEENPRNLIVRRENSSGKYSIVGFGYMIENGVVRQNNETLTHGDVITPIYYKTVAADSVGAADKIVFKSDDFCCIESKGTPFVYTRDSAITDRKIVDDNYLFGIVFGTPNGHGISGLGAIVVDHGKIYRLTTAETGKALEEITNAE